MQIYKDNQKWTDEERQSGAQINRASLKPKQLAKGAAILGGTVCSLLAGYHLFGRKVEGRVEISQGTLEGRIGRRLQALPELKAALATISILPGNSIPPTTLSTFELFSDPDGDNLGLEIVEKGTDTLPSWMTLDSEAYGLGSIYISGVAKAVSVIGNFAYLASGTGGLHIVDISNPSSPTLTGLYNTPGSAEGIHVVGNFAYIADNLSGLQIINISNPSSPVLAGTYDTTGNAKGVHVVGNFAYVADDVDGLQIIDVNNPSSPTLAGTYDTLQALGVHVVGNFAYISDDISGLKIIDVSNPNSPTLAGSYNTPDHALDVYVVGNFAFVADDGSGLKVVDVSNPNSPTLAGTYDTPNSAKGVHVVGNFAFVAEGTNGLHILDISNPNSPTLAGTYNTPQTAYGVHVVGNFAYVADGSGGLQIVEQRLILGGTSNFAHIGNYELELTATDPDGNQASQILLVRVEGPPIASGSIPNQLINVNAPFNYFIDQGVFPDPNEDVIFFSAEQADQNLLPSWLSFSTIGIFSGTPTASDVGTLDIEISAFDGILPTKAITTFSLTIDHFPVVTTPIANHAADIGVLYQFSVPAGTFYDGDVSDILTYNATLVNGDPLPSWLTFNPPLFSGTPSSAGTLSILLSATDPAGATAQTSFTLTTEHFPDLLNPIPDQLVNVDAPFLFSVPGNTFSDLDGDPLSLSVTRGDGSSLPAWLGFNAAREELQGTPTSSDSGQTLLKLVAVDPSGGSANTTFAMVVEHFPEVNAAIPDQIADIGELYSYAAPSGIFTDADDVPTITATLSNGNPLPSWLNFNAGGISFSGTPTVGDAASLMIKLKATDPAGAFAETSFALEVEHIPDLVNPIANQLAGVGQAFTFGIPANAFSDLDGDPLSYRATKGDGSVLPNWLGFSTVLQSFQGTPLASDKGVVSLKVIAEDPKGATAESTFDLTVVDSLGVEVARIGGGFVYAIPGDMITSPQGPITHTVTLGDGSPLPTWLQFNPGTATISGTPPSSAEGEYTVLITADDGVQAPVIGTMQLRVGTNSGPKVANQISNQVAQVDQKYRFVIPDDTFVDPNGDTLTLSALRANDRGLPGWLTFDADTRTLEGKPGPSHTGHFSDKTIPLKVCATDGDEQACSVFDLSVQGTSNTETLLFVLGPLASAGAIGLTYYKQRGIFLNPFNKDKYQKEKKTVSIGAPFTHTFDLKPDQVKSVQAFKGRRTLGGIPVPKSLDEKGWCEWLKHDRRIRGGNPLPSWLTYNEDKGQLVSSSGPSIENAGLYTIRAYGHGGVIKEEIQFDVGGTGGTNVEMMEF